MKQRELVRVRHGKVIAGVCGGIARRFGWSPTLVRLAFVVSCVLPGPQVLAYLALWHLSRRSPNGTEVRGRTSVPAAVDLLSLRQHEANPRSIG